MTTGKMVRIPLLLVLGAMLWGCEPMTQYKVLSVFFDGVPDPSKRVVTETETAAATQKKIYYKEHGPYAAKQCRSCHAVNTNRLVAPIEELCLRCHNLDLGKKWIHGPVASGGCRVCHSPHASGYPFLLVAKPEDFCFYCHSRADVSRNEVHAGATSECTVCHDPHSSNEKYLLRGGS